MTKPAYLLPLLAIALLALPSQAQAESTVATTDLNLTLETATTTPLPGSNIAVDLVIFNEGDFAADNAIVTIPVPAGLSLLGASSSVGGSYNEETGQWSTGPVSSFTGQQLQLNFIVDVDGPPTISLVADLLSFTSSFGGYDLDSTPGNMNPCEDDYALLELFIAGVPDAGVGSPDAGPTCGSVPWPDAGPGGPGSGDAGIGTTYDGGIGETEAGGGCSLSGPANHGGQVLLLGFALMLLALRRRLA